MKCVFCGRMTNETLATFTYEDKDRVLLVEHVPAEVCGRCGEKTYTPQVAEDLMRFAREEFKSVKTLEVPVYDFAEAG
jgi:HTH-type transcriptional regulator / antitoxin MqsA